MHIETEASFVSAVFRRSMVSIITDERAVDLAQYGLAVLTCPPRLFSWCLALKLPTFSGCREATELHSNVVCGRQLRTRWRYRLPLAEFI